MTSDQVAPVTRAGTPKDQETFSNLLSTLLNQCSYSPELQREYFSFFTTYILPHLQVFPNWSSNLTHNGSPFEPSRNIQDGQSMLRFCFEPIAPIAGTPADPFSQALSFTLAEQFGNMEAFGGFDTELWEHFTKELYVWEKADIDKVMGIKSVRTLRSCLFAFDLNKKKYGLMLKAYINCFRKAHILETSPAVILFDSIKRLPGREDEKVALGKLESFLMPRDGGFEGIRDMAARNITEVKGLNVVMTSFDLLDPLRARIKIYARSYDLDFANFKDVYTLGGQIHAEEQEMNVFKEFYSALFNLPETWDGVTEHVKRLDTRHAGVLWQFELMHGKLTPEVKLYISFWNFVPNDAEAARRLKRFFDSQSWDISDSYSELVGQLFNGVGDIEKEAGRHSYVSFSYTKERGPYLTLYYAPKLEREQK
ncbi:hypothetical protein V491_00393 [Pseudogymnoascus sp. VKM F-3775]|nr:hypothetical protein V491_00393 [Pseudogymnoascus sp. VKM F-3775]